MFRSQRLIPDLGPVGRGRTDLETPKDFQKKIRNGNADSGLGAALRQRLDQHGARVLSDSELLTLILGPGGRDSAAIRAAEICTQWDDLGHLAAIPTQVLAKKARISVTRARRLLAAIELGWRTRRPQKSLRPKVRRPEDLHFLLRREFQGLDRERFLALYLDSRHRVKSCELISVGTLNASLVHPREVFKNAIGVSAAAVIVAHNHPSGCSEPSADDLELTARLDRCGNLLGISLLDHLVSGDDEIVSIREYGWPAAFKD